LDLDQLVEEDDAAVAVGHGEMTLKQAARGRLHDSGRRPGR
jgi:hypothetical protein